MKTLNDEIERFASEATGAEDAGGRMATQYIKLATAIGESKMTTQRRWSRWALDAALDAFAGSEAAKAWADALKVGAEMLGTAVDEVNQKYDEQIAKLQKDKDLQTDPAKVTAIQDEIDKLTAAKPVAANFADALQEVQRRDDEPHGSGERARRRHSRTVGGHRWRVRDL